MTRHAASIGWHRRNSRQHRFAIPNEVWDYRLRPVEFVIFFYLSCHRSCDSASVLTLEGIAKGLHMTAATVKKYRAALVDKGLVHEDGSLAIKREGEKFFTLPNELFLLHLLPSAFVVYAYLLLIEDRRTHTCHPSYNTIAVATGLAKNTVMKSINTLLEMGLIMVEPSSYFDEHGMKWNGNNLYTILPVRVVLDTLHQQQFRQLELDTERSHIRKQQTKYNHRHPREAPCAPPPAQATPNLSPAE